MRHENIIVRKRFYSIKPEEITATNAHLHRFSSETGRVKKINLVEVSYGLFLTNTR